MGYLVSCGSMIALCLHTQFNFTNMEALLLMRLINIDARSWRSSGEEDRCGQSTCLGLTLTMQSPLPNLLILPPKENLKICVVKANYTVFFLSCLLEQAFLRPGLQHSEGETHLSRGSGASCAPLYVPGNPLTHTHVSSGVETTWSSESNPRCPAPCLGPSNCSVKFLIE